MDPAERHPDETPCDCDTRELFHRRGLRCTRQREVLYDALRASKAHPTADELLDSLGGDGAGLSLATVYNTLDALVNAGLIRRLPSRRGNAPARYDADITGHVHVSTLDGRVIDLPHDLSDRIMTAMPESLLDEIERVTGLKVNGLHVEVLGDSKGAR
ncbi:MAG: Fur family transcriptional regulator [Phycisphaerales bacterium JB040]